MFKPSSKIFFTDRSKVVLPLWIFFVIHVLCLACFLVSPMQPCGHLLGKGWPLGWFVFEVILCFVTFPCDALGQMWCLTVWIPDLCLLTFFAIYLHDD